MGRKQMQELLLSWSSLTRYPIWVDLDIRATPTPTAVEIMETT